MRSFNTTTLLRILSPMRFYKPVESRERKVQSRKLQSVPVRNTRTTKTIAATPRRRLEPEHLLASECESEPIVGDHFDTYDDGSENTDGRVQSHGSEGNERHSGGVLAVAVLVALSATVTATVATTATASAIVTVIFATPLPTPVTTSLPNPDAVTITITITVTSHSDSSGHGGSDREWRQS